MTQRSSTSTEDEELNRLLDEVVPPGMLSKVGELDEKEKWSLGECYRKRLDDEISVLGDGCSAEFDIFGEEKENFWTSEMSLSDTEEEDMFSRFFTNDEDNSIADLINRLESYSLEDSSDRFDKESALGSFDGSDDDSGSFSTSQGKRTKPCGMRLRPRCSQRLMSVDDNSEFDFDDTRSERSKKRNRPMLTRNRAKRLKVSVATSKLNSQDLDKLENGIYGKSTISCSGEEDGFLGSGSLWANKASEDDDEDVKIGVYGKKQRLRLIKRYLEKRKKRVWTKKIKYAVRKQFADSRMRVKGRFISKNDEAQLRDFLLVAFI